MESLLRIMRKDWKGADLSPVTALRAISHSGSSGDVDAALLSSVCCPGKEIAVNIHYLASAQHWITVQAIPRQPIRILDSIKDVKYSSETKRELSLVYKNYGSDDRGLKAEVFSPAYQKNSTSCGFFAAAFAVDVSLGFDPTKRLYPAAKDLQKSVFQILNSGKLNVISLIAFL